MKLCDSSLCYEVQGGQYIYAWRQASWAVDPADFQWYKYSWSNHLALESA